MNIYPGKSVTFTHDEIGTLAVRAIQRCNELGDKRKRRSELNRVARLLPDPESQHNADWVYKLFSVGLATDVNGEQLVVATYRMMSLAERQEKPNEPR